MTPSIASAIVIAAVWASLAVFSFSPMAMGHHLEFGTMAFLIAVGTWFWTAEMKELMWHEVHLPHQSNAEQNRPAEGDGKPVLEGETK